MRHASMIRLDDLVGMEEKANLTGEEASNSS